MAAGGTLSHRPNWYIFTPPLTSVLLQCDPAVVDDTARVKAVELLLELYEKNELRPSFNPQYRKLKHPEIAAQIKPYISEKTRRLNVKYAAIDITEACELESLQDDLISVALDSSEPYAVRINAAYAVDRICGPEIKAKLRPLAISVAGDDPDDELKGCGLRALWPNSIDARELFQLLAPPKNNRMLGAYRSFCSFEILPHLHRDDLPVALEWVGSQLARGHWSEKLVEDILSMAWKNLDTPRVLDTLARTIVFQLSNHSQVFVPEDSEQDRRRVAEAVMSIGSDTGLDPVSFSFCSRPLVTNLDASWLLEELDSVDSVSVQRFIATVIGYMADVYHQPDQLDAVLKSCKKNPILAETYAQLLEPVELGSDAAKKMEEECRRREQMQRNVKKPVLLVPSPSERVAARLKECQAGNLIAWYDLNLQFTLESDSTHYGDAIESDLTVLPGWGEADSDTRAEIIEVAKNYILERVPEPQKWLSSNLVVNYQLDYSGYRAFRLLWQEAPDFVSNLTADIWFRWAAVILAGYDLKESPSGLELLTMAYAKAPNEVIEALLGLVEKDNSQHGHVFATKVIAHLWDKEIAKALLDKSSNRGMKPDSLRELLRCLLTHKDKAAIDYAASLVDSWNPLDDIDRARAVVSGQSLLLYAPDAGWTVVWPVIQQDDGFGTEVVEKIIDVWGYDRESGENRLSDEQLADLYVWVVHHYPYEEDPAIDGVIGTRARIAMWKNDALAILKKRGASDAIEQIAQAFPNIDWLKHVLAESQVTARYNSWVPLKPEDILRLARNEKYRVIRSGRELLDAIEESLQRLQKKLHDETPAVVFLWDHIKIKKRLYKPKDENALSDFVKIHLVDDIQNRGVVFNREVEIRRARGSTSGERTDIYVSAFTRDQQGNPRDLITVIIEVKGCWNKELNEAMQTQLADRYLKDNSCQYGLYLVGWFESDCWAIDDNRRNDKPKGTLDEAKKRLCEQAGQLSRDGRDIRAFVMDASLC